MLPPVPHRMFSTSVHPIDPAVNSIVPHSDHDAAVVPPQRRLVPQDPSQAQHLPYQLSRWKPSQNPSELSTTPLVGSSFDSLTPADLTPRITKGMSWLFVFHEFQLDGDAVVIDGQIWTVLLPEAVDALNDSFLVDLADDFSL